MTPEQQSALERANACELAVYAAFDQATANIRLKTMSAKQATHRLNDAKGRYEKALRALHTALKSQEASDAS